MGVTCYEIEYSNTPKTWYVKQKHGQSIKWSQETHKISNNVSKFIRMKIK